MRGTKIQLLENWEPTHYRSKQYTTYETGHENIEAYDPKILPSEAKSFVLSYMESVWVSYIQKEHQETEVQ